MQKSDLTPGSHSTRKISILFDEEIANSISHGLGLLLALGMVPVLVLSAMRIGSIHFIVGASVFGGTVVLLYLASTLYHSLKHERAKHFFRLITARYSCSSPALIHHSSRCLTWSVGLDTSNNSLGFGTDESTSWLALLLDLDDSLSSDGLVGCCSGQADPDSDTFTGHSVDIGCGLAYTGGLAFS